MKNAIYLCKPKGEVVAALMVDEDTVSLTEQVASPWELTFTMHRYLMEDAEIMRETPYYESLSELMELYLVSDSCKARFLIDSEPAVNSDGISETKTVTAHSLEAELQYKYLENFQINTGQKISQENLVKGNLLGNPVPITDTTQELYDYNLNPYSNLPIDYITVCCRLGDELQEFRNNVSSTQIKWKFEGDDTVTTIPISFNTSNGVITGNAELLNKWYEEFTTKFPRVLSDITWGYDNCVDRSGNKQSTYGSIICVTETYIAIKTELNGQTQMYIPSPTYKFTLNQSGTAYNITYGDFNSYSFNRFLNGLDKIISFYEKFGSQLSMLEIVLEQAKATDWKIGDVPEVVAKKKFSFSTDHQDIYSFMVNDLSHTMKVIFEFDNINKRINVHDLSLDDSMYETGIVTGFQNLLQTVDITTNSTDGIKTTFKPTGANDLGITYVNFGKDKITNLDYLINKVDSFGEYQYSSAALHDKYKRWLDYRDKDLFSKTIPTYKLNFNTKDFTQSTKILSNLTNRELYIELSKAYNQVLKDINSLTYLVPSDGANTDYTSYSLDELKTAYIAYTNAYLSLVEIYKTEYGRTAVVESEIIQTYFYQDWKLYKETIIPNVLNALKIYALTDANGNFKDSNGNTTDKFEDFVYPDGGNPNYNGKAEIVTESKHEEYLYDMTLYGLSELNVKRKAWAATAAQAYKEAFVKSGTPGDDAKYRTWKEVKEGGFVGFTDEASYNRQLGRYLDYMSTTVRANSLTKKNTKGVEVLAADEIKKCEQVIAQMESIQETLGNMRSELANSVTYEGWGEFTDEELSILYSLSHEAEYSNENILTTNLDDIITTIDVQKELYDDACKRLFEKSRPQYLIATTLDNIMALEEFAPLKSQLKLLNYFYLKYGLYDDETLKLRIVKIQFNPIIKTEEFMLEFSNMTFTFEGMDDFYYLFDESNGVSSSGDGSSSSSSGSGGTYGQNDAEITISNNMLNALLKNNSTANSLNINNLLTTKQIENLLVLGDLRINGAAITDLIKSKNYNGPAPGIIDNTEGSVLNLENGQFSFGGGKLKFDGKDLILQGTATEGGTYTGGTFKSGTIESTTIKTSTLISGVIKDVNYNGSNNDINNTVGSIINLTTGKFNLGGGKLKFDGSNITMSNGTFKAGTVSSSTIKAGKIESNSGSTVLNLDNDIFSFANGKLAYDGSTLSVKGAISASTISGSSISGGTVSGTTISGGAISGTTIRASNIFGISVYKEYWDIGNDLYCDINAAALVYAYAVDRGAEEFFVHIYNNSSVKVAQLHDSDQYHVDISYVKSYGDGMHQIKISTSSSVGTTHVGVWVIRIQ